MLLSRLKAEHTVPVRSGELLIAEGWAVAHDARGDSRRRAVNPALDTESARSSTVLVYIFYKQENLDEFDTYLDRLTGPGSARV